MNPLQKKWSAHFSFRKASNGSQKPSWIERVKAPSFQKWAIAVGATLVITLLLSPNLQLPPKHYEIGDIAIREIRSTQDLLVEDERSTIEKRQESERSVLSVYDYDPELLKKLLNESAGRGGVSLDQSTMLGIVDQTPRSFSVLSLMRVAQGERRGGQA